MEDGTRKQLTKAEGFMKEDEVKEYFKTLELYQFHALIKEEAIRRLEDGDCACVEPGGHFEMREEHVAIINLGFLSYYKN